jgi:hypothetical protein
MNRRIKNSGDVSDTFMNEEALRFAAIEYDKFCLIKKVLDRLGKTGTLISILLIPLSLTLPVA